MEEAIKRAIKGGWVDDGVAYGMKEGDSPSNGDPKIDGWYYSKETFLDPQFWQCLGNAEGWMKSELRNEPLENWMRFIFHLNNGGQIDEFFEKLLNQQ